MTIELEPMIKYGNTKKTLVLDNKVFKVCHVKEIETGFVRKKLIFVHFDGKKWDILVTNPDMSKVRYVQLK